jgi:beta-glucanase (GH16 family)
MKKGFWALVIAILVSITIQACMLTNKKNAYEEKEVKTGVSKLTADNYDPGLDWKLLWSDEFEKEYIDTTKWNFQLVEAGRFNEEWQRYTSSSDNAYIDNNCLVIKAIHESDVHGMDQYTSARLNTANKFTWKYGKIAARIKLPQGNGIWPAFWMLGANINENGGDTPWPQSGEIDILEFYGSKDDGAIEANVHYADKKGAHAMMGAVSYTLPQGIFADAFHLFELEWDADKITWLLDGQAFASFSIADDELAEFHKDFFILLNLAVGGTYAGRPDDSTLFPQYMYIDWVRVYKKKN